jgi:predicted membrane-bound spermidine synthase
MDVAASSTTVAFAAGGDAARSRRVLALQIIFVVSGFCGLIYESIWSHYLKLFVGHAAYAQTVVLVVFIGGMAIGSWGAGRWSGRFSQPLRAYAAVEVAIGIVSLVFHGMFVATTDWAYAQLLPAVCSAEQPCLAQWLVAGTMILPQSVLLGTTFPLMTTGILRIAGGQPGARIALLYFLNSIGAVAGVLVSGFLLIPALGLPGTLLVAGVCNVLVALAAWACSKGAVAQRREQSGATSSAPGANRILWSMLAVAALTGLSSFIYEIVWIRMLVLVVGASTQAFELMLAAFILGLALGGLWVRKHVDRFQDMVAALAIVQILMGAAALATLPVYDRMFDLLSWLIGALRRSDGGYLIYNVASQGIAMAVMLPATFFAGMTLPLITTMLLRSPTGERAVGYVYAANTLGAIVGIVVAVHFALPALGLKGGLLLGAAIDIALGIALLWTFKAQLPRWAIGAWTMVGTGVLLVAQMFAAVPAERSAAGVFRYGVARIPADTRILYHRDGKTATVSVTESSTVRAIRTNGKPDAGVSVDPARPELDEYTMAMAAILPLAWHSQAKTAAIIGFGSGITTATMLGSPNLTRVDTIEIEPSMVEGARHFGALVAPAYGDSRSRIVIDDAKSYFARSSLRYDIIASEPSNPWVSGVSSLFTVEFYRRVDQQLTDNGIFVQWLQIYEFSNDLKMSILRALDAVFVDYAVYAANEADLIIIASKRRLPAAPSADFAAFEALRPVLDRLSFDSVAELEARRLASKASVRTLLDVLPGKVNSDYFPVVDHAAPRARFVGTNADMLSRLGAAPIPVVEMLEQRSPEPASGHSLRRTAPGPRRSLIPTAQGTVEWMLNGRQATGVSAPLPRDVAIFRAVLWDCVPVPPSIRMSVQIVGIASAVNPFVSPQESHRMWSAIGTARCIDRLTQQDLKWLRLAAAVGQRTPDVMGQLGAELAMDPSTPETIRAYALMAGVTGLVAANRPWEADQLLRSGLGKLTTEERMHPAFMLLAGEAAKGSR